VNVTSLKQKENDPLTCYKSNVILVIVFEQQLANL